MVAAAMRLVRWEVEDVCPQRQLLLLVLLLLEEEEEGREGGIVLRRLVRWKLRS